MKANKLYFNWSSGKDASLAFYLLNNTCNFEISKLVTTVNKHYQRVSMHGLRIDLLEKQAKSIGIPLYKIELPKQPTMEEYGDIMKNNISSLKKEGYTHTAFGDIFLEDLREYRDQQLSSMGIKTVYPIWKETTASLIQQFISLKFKAIIICVNADVLEESWLGREIDEHFLQDLPTNVDPCGENGEFHTFCYDGPIFKEPITFSKGDTKYREYSSGKRKSGFWFLDLR